MYTAHTATKVQRSVEDYWIKLLKIDLTPEHFEPSDYSKTSRSSLLPSLVSGIDSFFLRNLVINEVHLNGCNRVVRQRLPGSRVVWVKSSRNMPYPNYYPASATTRNLQFRLNWTTSYSNRKKKASLENHSQAILLWHSGDCYQFLQRARFLVCPCFPRTYTPEYTHSHHSVFVRVGECVPQIIYNIFLSFKNQLLLYFQVSRKQNSIRR